MRSRLVIGGGLLVFGTGLVLAVAYPAPAARAPKKAVKAAKSAPKAQPVSYERNVAPLVKKYCGGCHGQAQQIAGVGFHQYPNEAAVLKHRDTWEKVSQSIATRHMPPKGLPEPTPAERTLITSWIDAKLSQAACDLREPGRVTLRRLNRAEYNNTIRDLFGIQFRPADDFPSDDVGYGFDNIGDVLSISPLLMEKYLAAAEKITEMAIAADGPEGPSRRFEAEKIPETGGDGVVGPTGRMLHSNGEVNVDFQFPKEGEYLLRVRAFGEPAGTELPRLSLRIDGTEVQAVDVPALAKEPQVYEARAKVTAGKHRFSAAFVNDFFNRREPDPNNRDRNLGIDYLEIAGPGRAAGAASAAELPESHRRIFIAQPVAGREREAAQKILSAFARRAYRRPARPDEVERLVRIVEMARKEGDTFEQGVRLALQAVLVSPHFLFRVELDPKPLDPKKPSYPISDFELASRLSYFLWSSTPDDELLTLAGKGLLKQDRVLEAQVRRMLKDPKSHALVDNFAGQWLTLRNLKGMSPDPKQFPTFDEGLREAMMTETELFFESIMREDRSVLDLLDAKYTFLNERLAKHYGIDGVKGEQFRKVSLAGTPRGGILTHASILTLTSNPTRTSPVKRGKWVLEQILGTPPPPPPPDVPELSEESGHMLTGTLRQRLEQHRKDPGCNSCHSRLDPLGFGFENFDAIGAWRTKEGEHAVDASGTLPDGKSFNGPSELIAILKNQQKLVVRNLVEKGMTYALGRGMEAPDRCILDEVSSRVGKQGNRFSTLVIEIVKSEPFRMRSGEGTR